MSRLRPRRADGRADIDEALYNPLGYDMGFPRFSSAETKPVARRRTGKGGRTAAARKATSKATSQKDAQARRSVSQGDAHSSGSVRAQDAGMSRTGEMGARTNARMQGQEVGHGRGPARQELEHERAGEGAEGYAAVVAVAAPAVARRIDDDDAAEAARRAAFSTDVDAVAVAAVAAAAADVAPAAAIAVAVAAHAAVADAPAGVTNDATAAAVARGAAAATAVADAPAVAAADTAAMADAAADVAGTAAAAVADVPAVVAGNTAVAVADAPAPAAITAPAATADDGVDEAEEAAMPHRLLERRTLRARRQDGTAVGVKRNPYASCTRWHSFPGTVLRPDTQPSRARAAGPARPSKPPAAGTSAGATAVRRQRLVALEESSSEEEEEEEEVELEYSSEGTEGVVEDLDGEAFDDTEEGLKEAERRAGPSVPQSWRVRDPLTSNPLDSKKWVSDDLTNPEILQGVAAREFIEQHNFASPEAMAQHMARTGGATAAGQGKAGASHTAQPIHWQFGKGPWDPLVTDKLERNEKGHVKAQQRISPELEEVVLGVARQFKPIGDMGVSILDVLLVTVDWDHMESMTYVDGPLGTHEGVWENWKPKYLQQEVSYMMLSRPTLILDRADNSIIMIYVPNEPEVLEAAKGHSVLQARMEEFHPPNNVRSKKGEANTRLRMTGFRKDLIGKTGWYARKQSRRMGHAREGLLYDALEFTGVHLTQLEWMLSPQAAAVRLAVAVELRCPGVLHPEGLISLKDFAALAMGVSKGYASLPHIDHSAGGLPESVLFAIIDRLADPNPPPRQRSLQALPRPIRWCFAVCGPRVVVSLDKPAFVMVAGNMQHGTPYPDGLELPNGKRINAVVRSAEGPNHSGCGVVLATKAKSTLPSLADKRNKFWATIPKVDPEPSAKGFPGFKNPAAGKLVCDLTVAQRQGMPGPSKRTRR